MQADRLSHVQGNFSYEGDVHHISLAISHPKVEWISGAFLWHQAISSISLRSA